MKTKRKKRKDEGGSREQESALSTGARHTGLWGKFWPSTWSHFPVTFNSTFAKHFDRPVWERTLDRPVGLLRVIGGGGPERRDDHPLFWGLRMLSAFGLSLGLSAISIQVGGDFVYSEFYEMKIKIFHSTVLNFPLRPCKCVCLSSEKHRPSPRDEPPSHRPHWQHPPGSGH